ncbi:MAG TPA: zf-HC2 domain-containing protein, partial [Candidatus Limnocylindrales bacterium]
MADGARGEQRYGGLTHDEVADLAPAFVLDALPADDVERVREHLRQCPEAHPELAELGSVVPALARSVEAAQPAADLGARILAAARADRDARVASGELIPAPPPVAPAARTVPPAARRSPWSFLDALRAPRWAGAAIVAVAIVAVLGAWNLQLQAQIGGLAAYRDGVTAVLDAAASPGAQVAVLHGTADGGAASSSGLAAVDPSGRLVVAVRELS